MVRFILLLLIVVPAIEIGIFLLFGKVIGVLPTVLLIIFTGFAGAYLAKKQGLETVKKARLDMQNGRLPGEAILDGICILPGEFFYWRRGFDRCARIVIANSVYKKIFEETVEKGTGKMDGKQDHHHYQIRLLSRCFQ